MILFIDILTLIISAVVLVKIKKIKINSITLCLLVFDIAYVIPILVQLFFGYPSIGYYGFKLAINDFETSIIYDFFVIITQLIYYRYIKKNKDGKDSNLIEKVNNKRIKSSKSNILFIIANLFMIAPIFGWLFSPDPSIYFKGLGVFVMNTVKTTSNDYEYFLKIIKVCNYVGAVGIIFSKFMDVNNNKMSKLFRGIVLLVITILNGKRTFPTFIILTLLAIELISTEDKKRKIRSVVFTSITVLGYFILYAVISGKSEYNTNWYSVMSEYFFRGNTTKVAIYSVLNPDKLKILDYKGQSIIYNILYFIPRNIWENKPYQYPIYFTSAVFGFEKLTTIGWYFQTGIYGEMISNFGLIGILITPLIILLIGKISDNSDSSIVFFIGTAFICFIQVFEYSDMFKILFLLWLILNMKNKIFIKKEEKNDENI